MTFEPSYRKPLRNFNPESGELFTEEEFAEYWACKRKVQYLTRDSAKAEVKRLNKKHKSKNKVYRCRFCGFFHGGVLAHEKNKQKKRKLGGKIEKRPDNIDSVIERIGRYLDDWLRGRVTRRRMTISRLPATQLLSGFLTLPRQAQSLEAALVAVVSMAHLVLVGSAGFSYSKIGYV